MDLTGGHDEAGLIYSAADGTVVTSSCTDWSWDRISSRDNIFKYNNVSNVFDGSLANANYFGTYFVAPNGSSNVFTPSGYFMSNLHCSQLVLLVRFPTARNVADIMLRPWTRYDSSRSTFKIEVMQPNGAFRVYSNTATSADGVVDPAQEVTGAWWSTRGWSAP